ncbi:MAG: TIGR00266 family protein [Armatimonadia bacterium]|nr:TIGR00266 family protein [Armatimonadia bacterium]
MEYTLTGTTMQVLTMQVQQGEAIFTESGGMAWMSDTFDMQTNMEGGLLGGLKRAASGESMFMTTYTCTAPQGILAFSNEFPGKIIPLPLEAGESRICQKDSFMCAERSVDLEMHFRRKLGAGFFGGEGFIMQKITGPGTAFVELAGEIVEYDLQAGQALKVDTGHVAMLEPTVNFDIVTIKGVKNMFFGGEGLFLAHLTGPGKVWLQSMPIANLAAKISPYIVTSS